MSYFTTETDSGYLIKIPLKFRGYEIKKPCGKGAFASVVKVIDTDTKKEYAAKIIPKKGLENQTKLKNMINNEIAILQTVSHPNIIQLYEIVELTTNEDSFMILVEEYCSKGNLLDYILNGNDITDQEKRQISRGITEAVSELHRCGIAHCDIKPENVLLTSNKTPKLCDFNLSKFIEKANTFERGGSKPYAAPELFKFEDVDFLRADIWSLGVMLFSISESRYPYIEAEDARKGLLIINSHDKKLNSFTRRCLKINPSKRQTANELLDDRYLTSNGQIDEEEDGDDKMFKAAKKSKIMRMKSSPAKKDSKKIKRGEVTFNDEDNLPPINEDAELDEDEIDDDVFEMIYGYRRSTTLLDQNDEIENVIEKTIYSKKDQDKIDHKIDDDDDDFQMNKNDRNGDDNGKSIHEGSFAFSVMLELGYDFELQNQSESSQADELIEDDYENEQQQMDDLDHFEIEKIEKRICDSIINVKYQKKRKPKKKDRNTRRKDKKDWRDDEIDD